ncbi:BRASSINOSTEROID INSENSITIVE 1-associated receptor kinase 1-like [Rhodamnia argentea]|uniref:non-specific serine/threonine protein kinase n=1 Tax=Rhodamnia argentea TaxID=178133 RepID=A0A8B8NU33_9MYRT|nr:BRASSINOSTEROID INSENSITIVE 1-associated receptor kinase 1-like [Rhodamnia argentea]
MVFYFHRFSFSSPSREVGRTVDNTSNKLQRFSFKELRVVTRDFDVKNRLGEGSFGQVYRGCLADGSLITVKQLRELSADSEKQYQTEAEVAAIVRHPNILSLIGYCNMRKERLLVYTFMVNCSLDFLLSRKAVRPLDWPIQMRIASGIARGLALIHDQCHPSITHRDFSCSNALLTAEFEPILGDFGFARIMRERDIVVGCGPVFAAEVGKYPPCCPRKVDVHLCGNLLLDLFSGRPYLDLDRRRNGWVSTCMNENALGRVVDPHLQGNYPAEEAERLVRLALSCAEDNPSVRPEMSQVVRMLELQSHREDPGIRSSRSR